MTRQVYAHENDKLDIPDPRLTTTAIFRVVSVSENRNSFGLRGVVIMRDDGEAYEIGMAYPPSKGADMYFQRFEDGALNWAYLGAEIPRKLPTPPAAVIAEVFKQAPEWLAEGN